MNVTVFLVLFAALTIITPLITEAIKKVFSGKNLAYNIVVLIVSTISAIVASAFYFVATKTAFAAVDVFYVVFLIGANWLGSMLGYDKIKQAIEQIITKEVK